MEVLAGVQKSSRTQNFLDILTTRSVSAFHFLPHETQVGTPGNPNFCLLRLRLHLPPITSRRSCRRFFFRVLSPVPLKT